METIDVRVQPRAAGLFVTSEAGNLVLIIDLLPGDNVMVNKRWTCNVGGLGERDSIAMISWQVVRFDRKSLKVCNAEIVQRMQ